MKYIVEKTMSGRGYKVTLDNNGREFWAEKTNKDGLEVGLDRHDDSDCRGWSYLDNLDRKQLKAIRRCITQTLKLNK